MTNDRSRSAHAERFRSAMQTVRRRLADSLPTIIVSLLLLFSVMLLFGMEYMMVTPFLTLLFRSRHTQDFHPFEMLRAYLTLVLVCIAAFMATRTLLLCALLNLIVPFLIVYLLTNKFNPKAYFIYCMEFVFLQMMPIEYRQLDTQLLALTFGTALVTVSLFCYTRIYNIRRDYRTARRGMKNLSVQLEKMLRGEDTSAEHAALVQMMYHMNQVIYSTRGRGSLTTEYGRINYLLMIFFQRMNYFIEHIFDRGRDMSAGDIAYFSGLSRLFADFGKRLNQTDNSALVAEIRAFSAAQSLSSRSSAQAMDEMISLLAGAVEEIDQATIHRPDRSWSMPDDYSGSARFRGMFRLELFQTRFALRLSLVLCVSFTFTYATGLEHAYWYPMTSFLMLMPYAEESLLRINNRIIGTFAGVLVSSILLTVFSSPFSRGVIVVLMTFLMYYVPVTSWTMTLYTTCFAMTMATMTLDLGTALLLRLAYVILAAITTTLANRFILPNTADREFRASVDALFDIDMLMVQAVRRQSDGQTDPNRFRDLVMHSSLLSAEIEQQMKSVLTPEEQEFYRQLLPVNSKLVSEIEQLNDFLAERHYIVAEDENIILRELFGNLEDVIKRIRISFTRRELISFMETDSELRTFGKLEDRLYFNTVAFNCMETVSQLVRLCRERPAEQHSAAPK